MCTNGRNAVIVEESAAVLFAIDLTRMLPLGLLKTAQGHAIVKTTLICDCIRHKAPSV